MRTTHVEFVLLSFFIMSLQMETLIGEDQLIEANVEMPSFVIQQGVFHGKIQFIFKGDSSDELDLASLRIYGRNGTLFEKNISRKLIGVGKEWGEYQNTLNEYKTLLSSGGKKEDIYAIEEKLMNLLERIFQGMDIQTVTIDSNQLFGNDFAVGTVETMNIAIEYEHEGETHTVEKTHSIQILPPYPTIPVPDYPPYIDSHWYFGDLHVHTGYSSVAGYDGIILDPYDCDNCVREFENPSGYTIAQLRNNAWSNGRDWITITDHSYCINLPNDCGFNEWNHIQSEVNTYSYPNYPSSPVLIVRSEEVSLEEDSLLCTIDIACHLGAQFVNTYIPGGEFGQDITSQEGIFLVNRANGLSIINHPVGPNWDWCSLGNTGETGVEIWNGEWDMCDGDALIFWTVRLLRGDKTYAFAGSDTHDGIVDTHPMNGVYLPEFSDEALKHSLKTGHSFVTNGPALVLWAWPDSAPYFEYERFLMGSTVPRQPGEMVRGRIYYDSWIASTGYIYIYRGIIGQSTEERIAVLDVSMSGSRDFSDTPSGANVYYRAEFVSKDLSKTYRAYTNPVWMAVPAFGNTTRLFNTNAFFVAGETAKCTDVLGSARIAFGLSDRHTADNPEGRTDFILTYTEHSTGNLIIVGGPAVNPLATEFDNYFGVTYNYVPNVNFTIFCEGKSIYLDLHQYPYEDICIVCIKKNGARAAMLVWGYGWQGTYAGSVFIGNPSEWTSRSSTYMVMLRWIDANRDGLVQYMELLVEQSQSFSPGTYPRDPVSGIAFSNGTYTLGNLAPLFQWSNYLVTGEVAKCTDVLGSAKIAFGLGQGGTPVNPEGRTDLILTSVEHSNGNLIIVGGPAVNPLAAEFDNYFGVAYSYVPNVSFTIFCEGRSIYLNLSQYPQQDICIVYLGQQNGRTVFIVWGYGWQGTYAGSVFIGDPANWHLYANAHMLMLRWRDLNGDRLVQPKEITVESWT